MKLLFFIVVLSAVSMISAKISIAFLGVESSQEPLLKSELERQITKELRSLNEYSLKPTAEINLLYKKGVLHSPEVGVKRSSKIAKELDSRILSFGNLNRLEMDYHRTWFKPWRGDVTFSHSMWFKIIDALDGSVKYSGILKVNNTVPNKFLGWEPSLGKIDPVVRDEQLNILVDSLAKKSKGILLASIKGIVEQKRVKEKAYDPEFFEKQRKERKQKQSKSLKSNKKFKKKPIYKKSLFKPPTQKSKQKISPPESGLKELELEEFDLESIEEDADLLEDVNLMEGM